MTTSPSISLKTWLIISAAGILVFLMNIDYTAVNLVFVPVSLELNQDINNLQWLLSGYVLIWGAFVIPAGRIADIYGKRNTLCGGLLLFMIGSCLTGVAESLNLMILGRIIQGLGASIFTAPCWALIFTSAPPKKQGFVMGIILSFAGLGLAVGPTLSGYIIEFFNWRWIFYINIPVGVLVIMILFFLCQNDRQEGNYQKVDFGSSFLLAAGLCASVFALNQIEIWGIYDPRLYLACGVGFILLFGFFIRDHKKEYQMIPSSLLRNKLFVISSITVFFMAMIFSLVLVLMALYLQSVQKYSSYETGLIFFAMTISMGLLSPFGGQMVDKLDVKNPMIFAAFLTGLGTFIMASLNQYSNLYWIIISLFCAGTGIGIYFTAGNTAMMRSVSQADLNVASGIYTMSMMIGNTISIVFSTTLLVFFGRKDLFKTLELNGLHLTDEQNTALINVISKIDHTPQHLQDFSNEVVPELLKWIDQAFVYGFSKDMVLGTVASAVIAGAVFWGMKPSKKTR